MSVCASDALEYLQEIQLYALYVTPYFSELALARNNRLECPVLQIWGEHTWSGQGLSDHGIVAERRSGQIKH